MKQYPHYKDSGVEWLGEVPAHWQLSKLKVFTSFCGGGTPSRDNPNYWCGDIPWVSPKDMKSERITDAEECITSAGLASSSTSMIPAGQVLMVVRSGILKHTIPVAINDVPVALNQDMKSMRFEPESCTSAFFFRWVSGLNDSLLLAWAKQGATVESIEHSYLAETLVALPPLSEQTAISVFLDRETAKIDTLIAAQRRLTDLLKEKRQALISHLVTKGLDPDAPMKDSGVEWLGEVPAHWVVGKLQAFACRESGHTPSRQHPEYWENCSIPWFSLADVWQIRDGMVKYVYQTKELVSELGLANSSARLLPAGTVMLSRTASVGYSAIMGCDMATTQDFVNWVCHDNLRPEFLLYVLRGMRTEFDRLMIGSTHQTIYMPDIAKLAMARPPETEQVAICQFLDQQIEKIDSLVSTAEKSEALLQERRSALISAAVTGKIDVRGLTPNSEEHAILEVA